MDKIVEDPINDFDLTILNTLGNIDIYPRYGMGSSNIDVRFSISETNSSVSEWLVSEETDSDYRVLIYTIDLTLISFQHQENKDKNKSK